jgi:glycosyltransferase involved in cell wall biosynthesis
LSTPLRIFLVGDYPNDERLGSPKALLRLRDALEAAGHTAIAILAPELGAVPRQRHLRDALSPWLAARAVLRAARIHGIPDVIDASSAEGLVVARRRGGEWTNTCVVARSHGLEHLNYARMLDDAREGLAPRGLHRRVWYPLVRLRAVAAAARAADGLIVLNERDRRFALDRGWAPSDAIDVVPHGLGPAFLEPAADASRGAGFLFCGSWDRVKGIDYLARAFARVAAKRPLARLTILGPGVPADRVTAAFEPGVRDRLRVVERVAESGVIAEYRIHDVLVMCSTYEGYGMVVPEAMSQHLPVIATPVGAAISLVRDGETGIVVRPRDVDSLAAAMIRMADDAVLRDHVSRLARHQVRELTWRATASHTLAAYRRALARRRARTGAGAVRHDAA